MANKKGAYNILEVMHEALLWERKIKELEAEVIRLEEELMEADLEISRLEGLLHNDR